MDNIKLFNAVVVAENPDSAFIVLEENKLHATDQKVAELKQEADINIIKDALKALMEFSKEKVPERFLKSDKFNTTDKEEIVKCIVNIYQHLPHRERQALSSLIHHSKMPVQEREQAIRKVA